MTSLDKFERDYRAAFLRYLPQRDEAALHVGYRISRSALADDVSILDLAQIHHKILLEVLLDTPSQDVRRIATEASEFFLEVLAPFDMAQRGLPRSPGTGG